MACVYERRRSRWDAADHHAGGKTAAPAAVAQDPAYAELAASLARFRPGLRCFRARIFSQLSALVELAISRDDADAMSWATSLMHEHAFPLSDFPTFRRGDSAAPPQLDQLCEHASSLDLPPALAAVLRGSHPSFGWVQQGNAEKMVVVNAAFPADARAMQAAASLESQADVCGVHRADYVRAAEQCYAAIGPEIARAREAAEVGAARGGDDEALIELPPSLSRMLVRAADAATDAAADAKHFRLFVVRTHIHISRGGTRVAGVVQYAPAPILSRLKIGGGGGRRGQKRKVSGELGALFTDAQLDEWLQEVGGSDEMLEGLLGL